MASNTGKALNFRFFKALEQKVHSAEKRNEGSFGHKEGNAPPIIERKTKREGLKSAQKSPKSRNAFKMAKISLGAT